MHSSAPQGGRPHPVPFQLQPFPGDPAPAGLSIGGHAGREAGQLSVLYRLEGDLGELLIPPTSGSPQRLDDLWQSTCLECFLTRPGDDAYWEVNLSPAGHWNVYRLDGYRRGLTPEPSVTRAPGGERRERDGTLELTLRLPLPPPLAQAAALELGLTAVIAGQSGALSYWALRHPGPQADFHDRGGFALAL